jgi:hypothetical protein
MKKYLQFLVILIWGINCSIIQYPTGKGVFGVSIGLQSTGELVTYIAYLKTTNGIKYRRTLQADEMVKFASGYWPSYYNPSKEDLFVKENLKCGVIFDSAQWKEFPFCSPFDSLWKIRYDGHPFQQNTDEGWSQGKYRPSVGQEKFLFSEFGVKNIESDYFIDTSFWKLLRSVNDPDWIRYYKAL